jgi:hypothetical protein
MDWIYAPMEVIEKHGPVTPLKNYENTMLYEELSCDPSNVVVDGVVYIRWGSIVWYTPYGSGPADFVPPEHRAAWIERYPNDASL